MMHTRTSPQLDRKEPAQTGGLFSTRLLNALPYTNTVKDIYLRTKQKNEAARIALSLAEKAATSAITPFASKYAFVDKLAGEQWEKLDEKYGDNNLAKVVHSVTYPIAFSYGLAGYARNKMLGLASPVLQVSNEWADVIVDNLMPPGTDETIEEEYRRMQHRVRGPMDKIVDRTSVHSLIRLPANAFKFSINSFSSGTYLTIGFTEMSMARMWNSMTILVNSINTVFDEVLQRPWSASNNIDVSKLYQASVIFGARFVNAYIEDLEKMSLELKDYLEDHNLQYNAKIVELISKRIGMIESRLLQLGGSFNESKSEVKSEQSSKPFSHRPRYLMYTQRKVVDPSERMPSMLLGEGEHPVDQHLLDIEASRRPTLMAASPVHIHSHKTEAETERKVDAEIPLKRKHKNKKAKTAKPAPVVAEPEPVKRVVEEETVVDPDVDEHGFKLVKPKAHDHLLPQSVAQQMGKDLLTKHNNKHLPVTPTNSPAEFNTESTPAVAASEALVNNNPYSAIGLQEGKIVPGPARQVNEKEEIAHQKNVLKHTLSSMMHVVAERLEDDEAAQRAERHAELPAWETPKHPVHVDHVEPASAPKVEEIPAAAAENNPFEKLAELDTNVDPFSLGMSSM